MRRILLTLAEDATETQCGSCLGLDHVIDWCGPFGVRLVDEIRDSDVPGYRHARCAECLAAEAAAARMVEIAPEDAAGYLVAISRTFGSDPEPYERTMRAIRAHAAGSGAGDRFRARAAAADHAEVPVLAAEASEPSPPPTAPPLLEWGQDGPRLSEYERKRLERDEASGGVSGMHHLRSASDVPRLQRNRKHNGDEVVSDSANARRRVVLESPYRGESPSQERIHVEYAQRALRDSLARGEAPIASHLLYTQVLDDRDPAEREIGVDAGLAWRSVAEAAVFYVDHGMSEGMRAALALYEGEGIPVVFRSIEG